MSLSGRLQALGVVFILQFSGAPQNESRTGLIVGQVIDDGSHRPVAGAIVSISGPPGPQATRLPPVLTGADGRFVFRGLPRGAFTIRALKAGFVEGADGRSRPGGASLPLRLQDGQRTGDVVVRLWRHAAVSGTVVDESGERQVGVQIRAYRRAAVGGRRRFVPAGTGTTDDRGIYRIGTLLPGDYIIGTASRQTSVPLSLTRGVERDSQDAQLSAEMRGSGGALIGRDGAYVLGGGSATPPPPEGGRLVVYPPTFHPFAPAGEAASVISLQPGQEHEGADIQITPVTTVSISGFIMGPHGAVTATTLRLVAETAVELPSDTDGLMTVTDRRGAFVFPAVPSGHYSLRLSRGQMAVSPGLLAGVMRLDPDRSIIWADLPLSVGSEDIENLGVIAQGGLRISGRFEFDGDASRSRGSLPGIRVAIEPADLPPDAPARPFVARADRFGEFRSPEIPGGRYYVRIADSPPGWMFKSATLEGRDLADTPVTLTSDAPDVVITFTDRWSGLRGRVQADRGSTADPAVVVFPTDPATWGSSGLTPRRLRTARVAEAGEYSFNLPPGDYYVLAVPDEQAADWQDPAFLEAASRVAVRVRIADGEWKAQDLRVLNLR